ncbi:hypothetical protein PRIEUP_LOCUS455, partial [Pristimantis euphronides]
MERFLQLCLILMVTAMLYSASILPSSPPQQHHQSVDQALDVYNEGLSSSRFLFGLLQDESHDDENITFIIKETVCLKSHEKTEKCPFKKDGVVKKCTVSEPGTEGRRLDINCQTIDVLDDTWKSEENRKPQIVRSSGIIRLLKTGKKKLGINFLQFDNKSSLDNHAASSCLFCIFDLLNP